MTTGIEGPRASGVVPLEEAVHLLQETRLWAGVPEGTLRDVAERMAHRTFADGEHLITQGDPGQALHLVTSGSVEIRVRGEDHTQTALATLGAGESLGEMSLLTGDPASASVVARGPVESLALAAPHFAEVVGANGALLHRFVSILVERIKRSDTAVRKARTKEQDLTEFLRETDSWDVELVGKTAPVRKLRKRIDELTKTRAPILVSGEEGTGRRVTANMIHRQTARTDALVICVDCTQIGESGSESHLLTPPGHQDGHALCYLDLAEGGTLVLKNLERMPVRVQHRLAKRMAEGCGQHDVHLVATCSAEALAEGDRIVPELLERFQDRWIELAPLRERKRDIPLLAKHCLEKHAGRLAKPVTDLDDQAMNRLVSYDYRIANDRELEEAVERAVILADGPSLEAETIFLGPPPPPRRGALNLLAIPALKVRQLVGVLPRWARVASALVFAFILFYAFFMPTHGDGNLATFLVWGVWWPLLVLSFFFAGRVWCAACPIGLASTAASQAKESKRRIPAWLKKHDEKIAVAGLFLILFVEEATAMRHSPVATGLLLLAIIAGAVVTGFLYPRRTWCRHVCPLGGLAGACATAGVLELRPTFDVCQAKCTGHACYKGDNGVPGCPMFNHVMFVDTNQHCVLCMQCVQSCPNGSPQLNLRVPGREIWDGTAAGPKLGWFVLGLMGMLLGITIIQHVENGPWAEVLAAHRFLLVAAIFIPCAVLPFVVARVSRHTTDRGEEPTPSRFWHRVVAFAPVTTAGLVAYQLAYVPGLEGLSLTLTSGGADGAGLTLSILGILRVLVIATGLLGTLALLWRAHHRDAEQGASVSKPVYRATLGAALAYGVLLLVLMLTP